MSNTHLAQPARVVEAAVGRPFRAIALLYNAWLTGLLLSICTYKDPRAAGDWMFRVYRQHHHNRFLSSLDKLGIADHPPAVLAAQYHYLANSIGGVRVEYMYENDRKAWVRFAYPRWIYQGAAICAMPLEVSRAMLWGWFARNGVSLQRPELGFVCTSEDMDGQYGLAGYFIEEDGALAPHDRLRFRPGEIPPPFVPDLAPTLETRTWPVERLEKANRNYAMAPMRIALPMLTELFGHDDASALGMRSAKLIGLQYYEEVAKLLDVRDSSAESFAQLFVSLAQAQGDRASWERHGDELVLTQPTWSVMSDESHVARAVFPAWNGLWEGLLASHNRELRMQCIARLDLGDDAFQWRLAPMRPHNFAIP